ncbi:hypothetical protein CK203_047809 [Vitis vinifera]|uniref:Uncharacterized protein n=1 Tax=Vitis vinifera TaxID=29760 RepID=A0A438H8E5_VITVI|nr:hypothetical protein CK203_047809 [Vitis vinifera]
MTIARLDIMEWSEMIFMELSEFKVHLHCHNSLVLCKSFINESGVVWVLHTSVQAMLLGWHSRSIGKRRKKVDIWEERKVFGSRGQGLKDEMLGKSPPPLLVSNGKNSNPIKIVKRDSQSVRIKLSVGGMPEKIVTAFQTVHDEQVNEEAALNKCKTAVQHVGKLEVDAGNTSGEASQAKKLTLEGTHEFQTTRVEKETTTPSSKTA